MDFEQKERQAMQKTRLRVTALLISAVVLALVFAYWTGAFSFGYSNTILLRYRFAGGVDQGSPVRLGGIRVGRVTSVHFIDNADANVELTVKLSPEAFRQITRDSKFFINLAGLIGERYVEVVPGTAARVVGGEVLRGIDPPRIDQLISQGYGLFEDFRNFFNDNKSDIKDMLTMLDQLSGNLNLLIGGQTQGKAGTGARELRELSNQLLLLVSRMNRGLNHVEENGASAAWTDMRQLLHKGNQIEKNDLRRLMLEDGVKVNFSSKKVEDSVKESVK
ncbi:MAG: MlaD family protein [Bdellovibrionota bacterium]